MPGRIHDGPLLLPVGGVPSGAHVRREWFVAVGFVAAFTLGALIGFLTH